MRQYLSSLVVVVLGVACGGTTGSDDSGGAGSSAGGSAASAGSNHGGSSTAGTTSTAGKASGGSNSGGGGSGGNNSGGGITVAGTGGSIVTAGTGSGGTGVVNPDCPARVPVGVCSADDANVACEYDPSTGCLCYPSAPGTFTPCNKVDPTCTYMATPAAAPPPDAGAGGVTAKIALPPHQVCRCTATMWMCTFGI